MADYVPNTIVRVLKNVPLDDTYTDTRWFSNKGQQTSFFTGKAKYSFTDMTYQRVNNGIAHPRVALTCRVPRIADDLYDCNYMMFQNSNYGSRWFYAFIKQVNYINPNNTELVYEIDYLQTFMFDFEIKASFVEREHASAAEDKPYKNLILEPVGVSDWCEDISQSGEWTVANQTGSRKNVLCISVMPSDVISGIITGIGQQVNGIYTGGAIWTTSDVAAANAILLAIGAAGYSSSVMDAWMLPCEPDKGAQQATHKTVTTSIAPNNTSFSTRTGSYTIRNKKLLNSQFTYIKAYSISGGEMLYKPELLTEQARGSFSGDCYSTTSSGFCMYFVPSYNAGYGDYKNAEYGLTFSQSVHCQWASCGWLNDGMKAANQIIKQVVDSAAMGVAVGGASGASMGEMSALESTSSSTALSTTSTQVGRNMSSYYNKLDFLSDMANQAARNGLQGDSNEGFKSYRKIGSGDIAEMAGMFSPKQPTGHGGTGGDTLTYGCQWGGFTFKRMCATSDEMERLDTFFDMFGYQVNKVKVPNLDTREAWNYVKLSKPCIYGSVPVEGMAIIKSAFARGIRLWHVDAVGDYSIQNPPK